MQLAGPRLYHPQHELLFSILSDAKEPFWKLLLTHSCFCEIMLLMKEDFFPLSV